MKVFEIVSEERGTPSQGWKNYCKNTAADKMPNSWLNKCKAMGLKSRDTGKSQLKGNKRVKLDGKRARSEKYGGWVSSTRTG